MGAVATKRAAAQVLPVGGRIIFIGSISGTRIPLPGSSDYAGSMAAIIGYAKGGASDLGPRNITVNVVQPIIMPTDMMVEMLGEAGPLGAFLDMHPNRRFDANIANAGVMATPCGKTASRRSSGPTTSATSP